MRTANTTTIFSLLVYFLLVHQIASPAKKEFGEGPDHKGAIIDPTTRVAKEQKIAMEMAVDDFNAQNSKCSHLVFNFAYSHKSSGPATSLAVGDTEIMADRYEYAEFSQLYIDSGRLVMVFPKGSPLAVDISEAVLKVSQSGEINQLEEQMLISSNCSSSSAEEQGPGLGPELFSGPLLISGLRFFKDSNIVMEQRPSNNQQSGEITEVF
ncbi:hypothetical protein K7X08_014613 [Anisodus acutangulus]|uniref:Uncharacterized protein n=1 Tax=Anisodus acutangulus TaxID=402998 RepID=A0A9Q1R2J1_9SOLA|nr:hypothetical protein K7X08_014613 [Anisodus acutangulus]